MFFPSHLPLQKPPYWHHEARIVGRDELLKETIGERQLHDDLDTESDLNEAWWPMSEVVSLAVPWFDCRTYQGTLREVSNFGIFGASPRGASPRGSPFSHERVYVVGIAKLKTTRSLLPRQVGRLFTFKECNRCQFLPVGLGGLTLIKNI